MADTDNLMTLAEFSQHLGRSRTYAYQLRKEDRLVMTADGKHVLVAESTARIAATADPARRGVAERHARERGEDLDDETYDASDDDGSPKGYNFQRSKAKREHYAAERERTAARKEAGELIEVGEHVAAFSRAGAAIRATLEAWAAMLPPQLVGRDEAEIRATVADQVEAVLRDLAAQIGAHAAAMEGEQA